MFSWMTALHAVQVVGLEKNYIQRDNTNSQHSYIQAHAHNDAVHTVYSIVTKTIGSLFVARYAQAVVLDRLGMPSVSN